jgi:copper chaperone NosL
VKALMAAALGLLVSACDTGAPGPAPLDTRNDACAECRMAVSNPRFAAQIVAPGEDPQYFDDLGCLAAYLRDHDRLPPKAIAYVADHRSGEWVPPASAVFTRVPGLETPMGSHVVAHASADSREADPDVQGGSAVDVRAFFTRILPDGS